MLSASSSAAVAAPAAPATPRRRRKEARPHELLDAALALFAEKGFAATRCEEVAARAGVSKGTLFLYFPTKEDLFKAVVRTNLSPLIAEGRDIADAFEGPTAELLRLLLSSWWERVGGTAAGSITKIVVAEVRNFPDLAQFYVDEVVDPAHRLLSQTLRRGLERGEFRPVPVHDAIHALVAPLLFLAMHKHSIGACPVRGAAALDEASVIATHIDLMLHGLAQQPRTAPGAAVISAPGRSQGQVPRRAGRRAVR